MPSQAVVLGLGNVLVGDDGFGPFVARTMAARYLLPDGAEVLDIGTPGLDLAPHLAGVGAVIVIDTVSSDAMPGTLRLYRRDELLSRGPTPRTNPHAPGLVDTLFLLELQGLAPQHVLLIGVVPQRYDTGAPLSAAVRAAVPEAMSVAVRELERLGYPPVSRAEPLDPDIWWESYGVPAGCCRSRTCACRQEC